MRFVDFRTFSLWINLAFFAGAAVLVWAAGTRLATYADAVGARTRLSQALLGIVLLGVATSLPEIATTITGALLGNARLVAGNLLGGVALQIAILAVVDLIAVRGALTYFTPQPVLLFQGVMLLLLLGVALAGAGFAGTLGIVVTCIYLLGLLERRDRTVLGMGIDSLGVLVAYLTGLVGLYFLR